MIRILLILSILSFNTYSSESLKECSPTSEIAIVYLNGIFSNENHNIKVTEKIQRLLHKRVNELSSIASESNICIAYVYNKTNGYNDLIESTAQAVREVTKNFGLSEDSVYALTSSLLFSVKSISKIFVDEETIKLLDSEVNSEQVYRARANEQETLATDLLPNINKIIHMDSLKNLVLVSYSQGAFFANLVAQSVNQENKYADKLKNLQIATPSSSISSKKGFYLNSSNDEVIKYLPTASSSNILIQSGTPSRSNLWGHDIMSVYTSETLDAEFPLDTGNTKKASEHFLDRLIQLILGTSPFLDVKIVGYSGTSVELELIYDSYMDGNKYKIIDGDSEEVISTLTLKGSLETDGLHRKMNTTISASYNSYLHIWGENFTRKLNVSPPNLTETVDENGVTVLEILNHEESFSRLVLNRCYSVFVDGVLLKNFNCGEPSTHVPWRRDSNGGECFQDYGGGWYIYNGIIPRTNGSSFSTTGKIVIKEMIGSDVYKEREYKPVLVNCPN